MDADVTGRQREMRFVEEFGDTRLPLHSSRVLPTLSDPCFGDTGSDHRTREKDDLLGVIYRDSVRAYPTWIMDNVHMVNDWYGREPLLVIH